MASSGQITLQRPSAKGEQLKQDPEGSQHLAVALGSQRIARCRKAYASDALCWISKWRVPISLANVIGVYALQPLPLLTACRSETAVPGAQRLS